MLRSTLFFLLGLGAVCSAQAQEAPAASADAVIYASDYFTQYAPQTALDMVERVPGFLLEEGDDRRGFAAAQSNVLIDGEPPASKAQEIDDVLSRIPAADVIRIELIRGASSNAGSSQTVRVNVVRRAGRGAGVWEIQLEHARDDRLTPSGEAAWSGRRGDVEYSASASIDLAHLPIRGDRTDVNAAGAIEERRVEHVPTDEREGRVVGEVAFPLGGGDFSVNAQLGRVEVEERERSTVFDKAGAASGSVASDLLEREAAAEIGVSYEREFGQWDAEIIALATRRRFDGEEAAVEMDALGALEEGARQTQRIESGEAILRSAASRNLERGWRLELSGEVAVNTLEQRLSLTEDDGGGPVQVVLPSANVRVEEERAEASFMIAGALGLWSLEAGAAVETSLLTQSGDASRETELTYWKPSFQLSRTLGERNQLRFRFYRDVGQLDFEDFVAAADIASSVVDAGNPDLRPETSWRIEAAGDWRFGEDGALSLMIYRWWLEDALDIVPVGPPGDRLDAPGNIGDADVVGVRASLSLPLPFNVQLRIDALAQQSEAADPLTGERRSISGFDESALTLALRQDGESFAWGVDFEQEREAQQWRLDRIEDEQDADELTLWIETTAFADLKLRAWASNLSDSEETRRRRFFDPDRLGTPDGLDRRGRGEALTIGVSAGGRF